MILIINSSMFTAETSAVPLFTETLIYVLGGCVYACVYLIYAPRTPYISPQHTSATHWLHVMCVISLFGPVW